MTITYDHEGKCTRCGSTGYTPERVYDVTGAGTDVRSLVPCPCHGWRLITNETSWDDDVLMLYSHGAHQGKIGDSPPGVKLWQPLPAAPEEP